MTEFEASGSVTIRIDNLDSVGDDVAAEVERGFGSVTMQSGGGGGRGGRGRRRARRVARATQDSRDELSSQTGLLEDILDELGDGGGGGGGGGGDGGGDGLVPPEVEGAATLAGAKKLTGAGGATALLKKFLQKTGKGGGALTGLTLGDLAADQIEGPVRNFAQDVDVPDPLQEGLETGAIGPAAIRDFSDATSSVLGEGVEAPFEQLFGDGVDFDPNTKFGRTEELAERSPIPDDTVDQFFDSGNPNGIPNEDLDRGDTGLLSPNSASQTGQAGSSSGMSGRIESSSGGPSLLGSIGPSVGEAAASAAATDQSVTTTAGGGGDSSSGTVNVNAPVTVTTPLGDGVERNLDREFERIKREILQTVEQQAPNISEAQFDRFQTRSP